MTTDAQANDDLPPAPPRPVRDWVIVLALAIVSVEVIAATYFLARYKPSAESDHPESLQIPIVTNDEACSNFANYWMNESGVDVGAGVIEGLTNCWQAADGSWFLPADSGDDRLPEGFALSQGERDATNATREELLAEITDLERSLSNSMSKDLENIYDPELKAISGHVKETTTITRARGRYTRVAQSFLLAPEHRELADYIGWLMASKITAYERLRNKCVTDPATAYLKTACRGLEDSLSVWFPPWIWDLRDSVSLDAYLAHLVRQN